jgi:hypothetical protein
MSNAAEFILDFERKHVLILRPFGPYYADAVKRLGEQTDLQTTECSSLGEMAVISRRIGVCVLLVYCPDESHASAIVAMLEFCQAEIKSRKIRVLITVSRDFMFLLPRFIRDGATEVVQEPISPKILYDKIDRYLDILPSRDQNGRILPPKPRLKGTGADLSTEPEITWQVPLTLKSDCWTTIEGKTRWSPESRTWSVSLIGPPPFFGEWIPARSSGTSVAGDSRWEWKPNEQGRGLFDHEDGVWHFRGEKPKFEEGAWVFSGPNPKLAFYQSRKSEGTKVEGKHREIRIAEDSVQGKYAAELIEQAFRAQALIGNMDTGNTEPPPQPETPVHEEIKLKSDLLVTPMVAAFLVSELVGMRKLAPLEMLAKFCDYLKNASWGGQIEFWLAPPLTTSPNWICVQHEDAMEVHLQKELNSADGPDPEMIRHKNYRAIPMFQGSKRLGALVASGMKAEVYTDLELISYTKVLYEILYAVTAEDINRLVA